MIFKAFTLAALTALLSLPEEVSAGHCYSIADEKSCTAPPAIGKGRCTWCNDACQMASDDCDKIVSAEEFIQAAMAAAGTAAGTACATAHCAAESGACVADADCGPLLLAGNFGAMPNLATNSAADAAFTCFTGDDYTDCFNGKLEEAGGVAGDAYVAAAVAAGTTCAGTVCPDAALACLAELGCETVLNTGVYQDLATVETAAGKAALACFTGSAYLTCFGTTTAKNLKPEEEEDSNVDDPCNSEEASECAEYCLSCGQACTKDDGSLDLGSESCLAGTVPLGTWGCTEGKCGCLTSCLKCAAYQDCLPTLADDQSTALAAALTKMGLSESESTAILAAVTTYATVPSVGWTDLYTKYAGNLEGLFADEDLVKGLAETANLDASIQSSLAKAVACNSEEASECAEYCLSCGQACTKDDGVTLDVSSKSCLEATIPLGSWDCTEGTCGCLANCLKCVAYQECLPSDSDGENTDSEDALFEDAARAAAAAMGLNAEQVSAFVAIVESLPENSPLEKLLGAIGEKAFGESDTLPSIDALTATMKTFFASAEFRTELKDTDGIDADLLAAVSTASENAEASGAAGLALNLAVVATAAAALL